MIHALLEEKLGLKRYELVIHFISQNQMAELNERFLQHRGSTDVISFDFRDGYDGKFASEELAGEIYVSIEDAVGQAQEFATTWQEELARYIVHGVLHLRGYDDINPVKRRAMKTAENRLVKTLDGQFPLAEIGP